MAETKLKLPGMVQTERGCIWVEKTFTSKDNARSEGYTYSFTTEKYGDVFGMTLDDRGLRHHFALIGEY